QIRSLLSKSVFWFNTKTFLLLTCAYLILVLPWAIALSIKYQKFTLGTSGSIVANTLVGKSVVTGGGVELFVPPNPYAIAIGEDRTDELKIKPSEWEKGLGLRGKIDLRLHQLQAFI